MRQPKSAATMVQVHGKLKELNANLRILPPERKVQIMLHLETAFEQSKVVLTLEKDEEDAKSAQGVLTSGAVEDQLQRAILFSAACVGSSKEDLQEMGNQVLLCIDELEQYGRITACITKMTCIHAAVVAQLLTQ